LEVDISGKSTFPTIQQTKLRETINRKFPIPRHKPAKGIQWLVLAWPMLVEYVTKRGTYELPQAEIQEETYLEP